MHGSGNDGKVMTNKRRLRVCWGKPEGDRPWSRDLIYHYPTRSADGALLAYAFSGIKVHGDSSLVEALEARGFDISTLKFSIQLKDD